MKIWFNHWFSTAYHLIGLIRQGDPERFTFIGTNQNETAVYQKACDEWAQEPSPEDPEAYVQFCLDFCREHRVDIFVPRRRLPEIVAAGERFRAQGVRLLANDDPRMIRILDDKQETYRFYRERGFDCLPPVRIAHSLKEFQSGSEELQEAGFRVCYKLVRDEGARSFRVIDESMDTPAALLEMPGAKVTKATALRVLSGHDFENPVLLMPYLSGTEISADCLTTDSGPIIIPRFKTNARYAKVMLDETIVEECRKILSVTPLPMPANIQFKMDRGKPWLLEINPRMSGGLQQSCLASGINIPSLAVHKLLGEPVSWSLPQTLCRKVANIETPICLD